MWHLIQHMEINIGYTTATMVHKPINTQKVPLTAYNYVTKWTAGYILGVRPHVSMYPEGTTDEYHYVTISIIQENLYEVKYFAEFYKVGHRRHMGLWNKTSKKRQADHTPTTLGKVINSLKLCME